MPTNDMTFKIGGEAGMGVESTGAGFCKALARSGVHIFGLPDYYSRIRGGHNFFTIRVGERPLYCTEEKLHLLIALTGEAVRRHRDEVAEGGGIIYDEKTEVEDADALRARGVQLFPVPLTAIAREHGGDVMRNTVTLGAAAALTGFDFEYMASVISDNFARKGPAVVDDNLRVAEAGYKATQPYAADFPFKLAAIPDAPPRMVINGNDAFALGALLGGCRVCCAYPMTPGSPVLHWLAAHAERYGVVTKHTEDEIAAINMAIGAGHVGARALVPTSGGGFSLMVEALGLAAQTETPVVIYNAQRPGPSTGLPTRSEQADLLFTLYASQGEFPRFILAPGTQEESFVAGWRAFNLAERFQVPALVLSDHYLAVGYRSIEKTAFDFDAVEVDRGELLRAADLDALEEEYLRFKLTASGVSPRALPGHPKAVWVSPSNEHDERGAVTEDPEVRTALVHKRQRKLAGMAEVMNGPTRYGPPSAEVSFICWGSTYGPLREAVDRLDGRANLWHFSDLWPLPVAATEAVFDSARRVIAVEGNATAQLATLIRGQTGRAVDATILKYDGRGFTPEYILAHVPEEV